MKAIIQQILVSLLTTVFLSTLVIAGTANVINLQLPLEDDKCIRVANSTSTTSTMQIWLPHRTSTVAHTRCVTSGGTVNINFAIDGTKLTTSTCTAVTSSATISTNNVAHPNDVFSYDIGTTSNSTSTVDYCWDYSY
jgi:hypothetical protein